MGMGFGFGLPNNPTVNLSPEVLLYNNYRSRVITDGGVIINSTAIIAAYKSLLDNGLNNSLVEWHSAIFGVKIDGSNNCSKLYDLSSNNNDKVQATLANQPLWTANTLVFDGVSDYLQIPYNSSYGFLVNFTAMERINPAAVSIKVLAHSNASLLRRKWAHGISPTNKFQVLLSQTGINNIKDYSSVVSVTSSDNRFGTTFATDDLRVFMNGAELTVGGSTLTKSTDLATPSLYNNMTDPITTGALADRTQLFNGIYKSSLIFYTVLTPSQIITFDALL